MRIALAGEALIDFTSTGPLAFQGHEGGAVLNSAIACARLGQPTAFITQLSEDLFGEQLLAYMQANGVDTRHVLRSKAPSTLAFVERTPRTNRYAFYMQGTADVLWAPATLPELPESCRFLHFGSISLLQDPAGSRITQLVEASQGRRVIVFDPNMRPSLLKDIDDYRRRYARWLRSTDVLKLSDEDAALLSPGLSLAQAAASYLQGGPRAVVITSGGDGATLYRPGHAPMAVRPPPITVADTIGAGDTFTAGLSVSLLEHGVEQPSQIAGLDDRTWAEVLQFAATAAALNCTREGADPPTRDELRAALSGPQ
jgi:fructokinase